jgi:hypothetical protein
MNDQNWFSQFFSRLVTQTPTFFKKVIAFGITVGAIGIGLVAVPAAVFANIPLDMHLIGGYMIAIGTVAGIIAKSTTTDSGLADKGK